MKTCQCANFAKAPYPRNFLSSEITGVLPLFVWAPLPEWQAGGARMQTKVVLCRLHVHQHHTNAWHPPCRCQAASWGGACATLNRRNARFGRTRSLAPPAYRKNGEQVCWCASAHLSRMPCRGAWQRTMRPDSSFGTGAGWPSGRALPKRCWRRASIVCEGNAGHLLVCPDFSKTRFWKLSVWCKGEE